jgi:hypothetical protein
MIGDMKRPVTGHNLAPKATGSVADRWTPPTGFRPAVGELVAKRTKALERAARGQKSWNRPANPLTCRASDLLCLDANATKRPWFRGISAQMQTKRTTPWGCRLDGGRISFQPTPLARTPYAREASGFRRGAAAANRLGKCKSRPTPQRKMPSSNCSAIRRPTASSPRQR